MNSQKSWFDSYKLGSLTLKNRMLMAPLTRMRCEKSTSIPNDLLLEYYKQRASFGMIITECSPISQRGNTFPGQLIRKFKYFSGHQGYIMKNKWQDGKKLQMRFMQKVVLCVFKFGIVVVLWHKYTQIIIYLTFLKGLLPENMACWGPSEV